MYFTILDRTNISESRKKFTESHSHHIVSVNTKGKTKSYKSKKKIEIRIHDCYTSQQCAFQLGQNDYLTSL